MILAALWSMLAVTPLCPEAKEAGWLWADNGALVRQSNYRALPALSERTREGVGAILRGLRAREVLVAVALVPDRGMVIPATSYDMNRSDARYQELLGWLEAQGAIAPDLLTLARGMKDAPYFNTLDHHWTPEGARATARALSAAILARPAAARLPKNPQRTTSAGPEPWHPVTAEQVEGLCGGQLPDEVRERFHTEPVEPPGLLDEIPPPRVVLVGTSFTQERFNFGGFLAEHLGTDVLPFAVHGGAALGGIGSYLYSDDYQERPPMVLVWEIPVQNLLGLAAHDGAPDPRDGRVYRELAAAARGGCAEPLERASGELQAGEQTLLANLEPRPRDLLLELPEPKAAWSLRLLGEGQSEEVPLAPYGRMPRSDRLFWTLPAWTREVRLVLPAGAGGAYTLSTCPRNPK